MSKWIAIYVRVSTKRQDHRSQLADLKAWAESQEVSVRWYKDKASGRDMNRPGWQRLEADMKSGRVSKIVTWRLDRLGRTAAGLTKLFETLRERRVGLVSLKDCLDLSTAAGRLMAHVLASVAAYENEVRSERIRAGQAAAKAQGKTWGGSEKGRRVKVSDLQIKTIRTLKEAGEPVAAIARTVGLSRPTIYSVLSAN